MISSFTNKEIASLLRKVAAAYTIKKGNRFRIMAYERAADAVEHATSEVKDLWDEGKLQEMAGIGKGMAFYLDELFRTGRVGHFEKVMEKLPETMFMLLDVPGIGPKKAFRLVKELGLTRPKSLFDDLKKAASQHKICQLTGFGDQSERDILEGIAKHLARIGGPERMLLHEADLVASEYRNYLKGLKEVSEAIPMGSLRRRVATIGDIDIGVAVRRSDDREKVVKHFVSYPQVEEILNQGATKASVRLKSGVQVDIRVQDKKSFGALLQYFTGSKHHNIKLREYALDKGLSLSEWGIKTLKTLKFKDSEIQKGKLLEFKDEVSFYEFLGMEYIEPELREETGEIEAALRQARGRPGGLPNLVELKDIKGDLQTHSNLDIEPSHDLGISSMEEMAEKARALGYKYLAFSEHNPSVSQHSITDISRLLKKRYEYIEQLKFSNKTIRVIKLLEVDILSDGTVPIPIESQKFLDGILVAIHSAMHHDRQRMTKRIIKGLSHPLARILAHPTGRLLNERESYEADWKKIMSFCKKQNKAMEVNGYPNRLDLPETLVREAVRMGVKLSLGTDAHRVEDMEMMKYGVAVARRGWAAKNDIINTWDYEKLMKWLKKR